MMKTKRKQIIDRLKAAKAANRSDEIRAYADILPRFKPWGS